MAEDRFDAIIVGGGLAGIAAAYRLAQEGLEVLVVERGNTCGSKNMTGGRLYTHTLEKLIPDLLQRAPLERRIVKERFSLLTPSSGTTIEVDSAKLGGLYANSYSVLRAPFDRWLADEAEAAGVMFVCGVLVDDLIIRDGRVCGIIAGEEEMEADVVILAEGVNAQLAQKAGLREELQPDQVEVGAKEVLSLDQAVLEDRFHLAPGEGIAWIIRGEDAFGPGANGFLYTNKDTISLGVVTEIGKIPSAQHSMVELVDLLKEHPVVAPLIAGSKTVEYSAHLLPCGQGAILPRLCGDGVLLAGDAAGLAINLGYVVRGMDLAVESGLLCAETVLKCHETGDFSREALSSYETAIQNSFIPRDMERCGSYAAQLGNKALYDDPAKLIDVLTAVMQG